jgi:hypothetical protein
LPAGATGAASTSGPAAAEPDADDVLVAEATAALTLAEAAADASTTRARQARADASVHESLMSATSAASLGGGGPASPFRADPAREQQNLAASSASLGHSSEAINYLTGHARKFPLIAETLHAMAGGALLPASLGDFSILVLLPALHAAKQQEHGLKLLLAAARREAPLPGPAGKRAVDLLEADLFDLEASTALQRGAVTLHVSTLAGPNLMLQGDPGRLSAELSAAGLPSDLLSVPELTSAGLTLLGGRALPGSVPGVVLVYSAGTELWTLQHHERPRPEGGDIVASSGEGAAELDAVSAGGVVVVAWTEGDTLWLLGAGATPAEILQKATDIRAHRAAQDIVPFLGNP